MRPELFEPFEPQAKAAPPPRPPRRRGPRGPSQAQWAPDGCRSTLIHVHHQLCASSGSASLPGMSPASTPSSSGDFQLETPSVGSFDSIHGSCDNLAMPVLPPLMLHDRALALAAAARHQGLDHLLPKRVQHTHTRSLSRSRLPVPFPLPSHSMSEADAEAEAEAGLQLQDGVGSARPAVAAVFASPSNQESRASGGNNQAPHLAKFSIDIHPGLRWREGDSDLALLTSMPSPSSSSTPSYHPARTPEPEPDMNNAVPRAGTSLRRTRSSAGRPERAQHPQPPLPHLPSGSAYGVPPCPPCTPCAPCHCSRSRRPASPPLLMSMSKPMPPIPSMPPTDPLERDNELAIACAAQVAVRRRVVSVPKSPQPALHPWQSWPREKHRRSTSLGGDQVFTPPTPLTHSHPHPHSHSRTMSQRAPQPRLRTAPKLPKPMPFHIPRRAPPPPPIVVPLNANAKRVRSPPPPPSQSSPPPPPKALPALPTLPLPPLARPPPTRSLPPPPPGPPPKSALPPLPLELPPIPPLRKMVMPALFSPAIPEPLGPAPSAPSSSSASNSSRRSAALGPDSAYARYRARSRAKTLASSFPTACEPVEAAHAANGEETLAEAIAAIREAEEWDWPIPPLVRRPSKPADMSPRKLQPLTMPTLPLPMPTSPPLPVPIPGAERVEELRRVKSCAPDFDGYSMHPFAAARQTYAPRARRGSTASLAAQHSGSSLGSDGPRTPDECPSPPQFALVRGPSGLIVKPIGPQVERPARRYGTPF
ncbi:hypothetical protein CC85DRAFT_281597 [Cutaneotrichosporon oleaginosum]|uniref:Uncharacterized protein n=1 Tax=Cutaneotrichosporon oleaginosum TaxID=879819 RepID=A0A0J0XZM8_9TREE|nr:uncharacterized protein CC85DRAFT_281597 [Cutaneotrichosporon oleaginosum]KLT46490.1 hypothetical protein CC85DRAFT_281597 [Cutaneotrichosporon oleaginosum]TXT15143.1 hypothetical protein COLE_01336 [Cutaneotrichosporon oleaginosum]